MLTSWKRRTEIHLVGHLRIPQSFVYMAGARPCIISPSYIHCGPGTPSLPLRSCPWRMCASGFHSDTPHAAQIVQPWVGTPPQTCLLPPFPSVDWLESKEWGKWEPELTPVADVTGRVHLEGVQRSTRANLISCCLDWQAPPLSMGPTPQRVGGKLCNAYVCYMTSTYQNLHRHGFCLLKTMWKRKHTHLISFQKCFLSFPPTI